MCTYSHVNLPYCGLTQIDPLTIWKQYVIFTSRPAEQLNEVVTFVFSQPFFGLLLLFFILDHLDLQ